MSRHVNRRSEPTADDLDKLREIAAHLADLSPDALPPGQHARMLRDVRAAMLAREPGSWGRFFMMNQEQALSLWDTIMSRRDIQRRHQVFRAACILSAFAEKGTSEVLLDRERLAKLVRCSSSNLSTVIAALKKLKVITRTERRRIPGVQGPGEVVYYVNPRLAWNGTLQDREAAARKVEPLALKLVHSRDAAE